MMGVSIFPITLTFVFHTTTDNYYNVLWSISLLTNT